MNKDFLEKLKLTFGKKQLLITVEEDEDDSFFLLSTKSNREKFKQSLKELENNQMVTVSIEELRK